jgi:hypothetical protein
MDQVVGLVGGLRRVDGGLGRTGVDDYSALRSPWLLNEAIHPADCKA